MSQILDEFNALKAGDHTNARQFVEHLVNILTRQTAAVGANSTIPQEKDDTFWGYVFNYVVKDVDFDLPAMYAVTYRNNQLTLLFNPNYISPEYDVVTMLEGLRHEGYHLLFNHLQVHAKLEPEMSNIAADCEINQQLRRPADDWVSLDYVAALTNTALSDIKAKAGSLYYYDLLAKNCNCCKSPMGMMAQMMGDMMSDMSGACQGSGQSQDSGDEQGEGQSQGSEQNQSQDSGDEQGEGQSQDSGDEQGEGQSQGSGDEQGKGQNQSQGKRPSLCSSQYWSEAEVGKNGNYIPVEITVEAVMKQALSEAKSRGTVSQDIEMAVEALNKPAQVKWQREVQRKMGRQVSGQRKSPNRLYRRNPDALHKKGTLRDRILPIVFAFDVSGSVSPDEANVFFNEIVQMVKRTKHPVVQLQFDAKVSYEQVIDGSNHKNVNLTRFGCGGTTFQSIFDYLKANNYPRETQIFIFTDGGGERHINPYGYTDYTWLLTDKNELSVSNNRNKIIRVTSK